VPELSKAATEFRRARDLLLERREDYDGALRDFSWPQLDEFNWALEHFDAIAADPGSAQRPALWVVEEDGREARYSFADMSERSNRVANWLRAQGVGRGDRVILMLANQVELWDTILAVMKLGAVLIPSTPMLGPADLRDRIDRGNARHVVVRDVDVDKFDDVPGEYTRIAVGDRITEPWLDFAAAYDAPAEFAPDGVTKGSDTLLLYFTSGTTAKPKLVEHTHTSYPVGHLSTMYWIGLQPGDVHLNVASPGWAKHAWSNVFAPWIAEATIFIYNYTKFDADRLLDVVTRLTKLHEGSRAKPWAVTDAPEAFIRSQLRGIVGVRLPITRLEGKRKMSQNRSAEDRAGVAAGLAASDRMSDREVAALIPT
jgi:acetyl-CoA synthetase